MERPRGDRDGCVTYELDFWVYGGRHFYEFDKDLGVNGLELKATWVAQD